MGKLEQDLGLVKSIRNMAERLLVLKLVPGSIWGAEKIRKLRGGARLGSLQCR